MKYLSTFLLLLVCTFTFANNDKTTLGARAAGLGNASTTFSDVYATFANQAGLASLKGMSIGIFAENRFLLTDLNLYALGFALPTKGGTFGLGASYFGNGSYNETQIRLGYGIKLADKLSIGAEFDFLSLAIQDNGSKATMTFGVGIQYQINKLIKVGGHVYNPIRQSLTDQDEDKLPAIVKFGLAFTPSKKAMFAIEAEHNMDHSTLFKVGVEYQVIDILYLRGGFNANPTAFTFGVGLNLKSIDIDIAAGFHPVLGYSPAMSATWMKE